MNKLSIITINYNDLEGLKRTVESVLNQTWKAFEYIVIDGGSTDGSKEYIETHSESIDYWISEPDSGIYNAMNKGIAKATGEYLFFLNSGDDFNSLEALEELHLHLCEKDIVYFDINMIGENYFSVKKCPKILTFEFLHDDLPPHQSTFIRKKMFDKWGYYDESLKIVADWKFLILAVCKYNATYKKISDIYTNFYLGGASSSEENYSLIKEERALVLNSEFSIFMNDLKESYKLKRILRDLRRSKKINFLIRLRLLNEF